MARDLPWSMRRPRKAAPEKGCMEAWWYIDPAHVRVYAQAHGGGLVGVELTRKQLETALFVMNEERDRRKKGRT